LSETSFGGQVIIGSFEVSTAQGQNSAAAPHNGRGQTTANQMRLSKRAREPLALSGLDVESACVAWQNCGTTWLRV